MNLTSSRLILREMETADWQALHAVESDPEVVRYQSFAPFTPEKARDYIAAAERDRSASPRTCFDFAVVLSASQQMIGRVGMKLTGEREASLWFSFARSVWGQGHATEAARALISFGFRDLGLHRIFGDCDPRNLGSMRVMEKLGMRREAHHRENALIKGEWCDSLIYAVLDREWS